MCGHKGEGKGELVRAGEGPRERQNVKRTGEHMQKLKMNMKDSQSSKHHVSTNNFFLEYHHKKQVLKCHFVDISIVLIFKGIA